jgi:Ca2+-binding EF-hand superfamily protein
VSSQQDERLTEEESADSVVQKPTRQKPTPQMANSIVQQYDQNSDGEISVAELGEAGQDFAADELTIEELAKIGQEFANN